MAEQEKSEAQVLSETAKTSATAVKAAGIAASGNFAGAAITLLKDERIRNGIIATILTLALIVTMAGMFVGSAITGIVQYIAASWEENWEQNIEEQGIASGGNAIYYYTIGSATAFGETVSDVITGFFETTHKVNGKDATNKAIDSSTQVRKSDYEKYIDSIKYEEALTSENGSLARCLEMIKNRVKQRGKQIKKIAGAQYNLDALGKSIGQVLAESYDNPILFAGVDVANSKANFDSSAFELTDLQAMKILAAYSIQHDCDLHDIDMFDLMDYCGWYDVAVSDLETNTRIRNSIYDFSTSTVVTEDIGNVEKGTNVNALLLAAPKVPRWKGTMAPQWYYEEIAQIKEHNRILGSIAENTAAGEPGGDTGGTSSDSSTENTDTGDAVPADPENETVTGETIPVTGETDEILWDIYNNKGEVDVSAFEALSTTPTIGMIDKLFTNGEAKIRVSRSEYHGADEYVREGLSSFLDKLFPSSSDKESAAYNQWVDAYQAVDKTSEMGNTVTRDTSDTHYITVINGMTGTTKAQQPGEEYTVSYYYYVKSNTGKESQKLPADGDGYAVTFYDLDADTAYTVFERKVTKYHTPVESADGTASIPPDVVEETIFDTFTTFEHISPHQAYKIQLNLTVSYSPRSIDELAYEVMGLWPGSFAATETKDGVLYPEGHSDNKLMAYEWIDTYTDPTGVTHELSFTRQYAYQYETYKNLVEGIGELLEIDTSGLYVEESTAGTDIVSVAQHEYEYYHANNLQGGARYWQMVNDAGIPWSDYSAGWCVAFVYCCAWQCGYIGEGECFGPDWYFGVSTAWHFIQTQGKAEAHSDASEDYRPVPGDLIFFAQGGGEMSHIGIVEYVDNEGKPHIIHGNTTPGSIVNKTSYTSYRIGTDCGDAYIFGYLHPDYPQTEYTPDPGYVSVSGNVKPTIYSRYVTIGEQSILLSGMGRFRKSQLQTVLTTLAEEYPAIYREDLQSSLDTGDWETFMEVWNDICSSEKTSAFRQAQLEISEEQFVDPICSTVRKNSKFDWQHTTVRSELLHALVTTSDQTDALVQTLTLLASGIDTKSADSEFVAHLNKNDFLTNTLTDQAAALWPDDSAQFRLEWISSISTVLQNAQSGGSTGSLSDEFYIDIPNKDPSYKGHAVYGLTDAQIHNIKNTIYGEANGLDLDAHIAVAQTIRDNVDRSEGLNYDNFIEECGYYGGQYERSPEKVSTDHVNAAFDYVFNNGGSAVQHPIWVFYSYSPSEGLYDDADFQEYFYATLVFVVQCGNTRFFSWEY